MVQSPCFLGQSIEVGKLVHDYTDISVEVVRGKTPSAPQSHREGRGKKSSGKKRSRIDTVEFALIGSEATVMRVRSEVQASSEPQTGLSLLSQRTKIDFSHGD
jgi:hypothetical protein